MEMKEGKISTEIKDSVINKDESESKRFRLMAGLYVVGVSGVTAVIAGLVTSHIAKKKGRAYFKEFGKQPKIVMESPTSLALRALAWATFWSVGFCSLTVFSIWKWYDIKDLNDLRQRVRKYTRRSTQGEGRTEFESLSDLLSYINETSKSKPTKDTKNT